MPQLLNVIIIDDEQEAIDLLSLHLMNIQSVRIIGKFTDPQSGFVEIAKSGPQLVFMDIEMPKCNGFDLLQYIHNLKQPPFIVFVTGYDKYMSYMKPSEKIRILLKPVDPAELQTTIDHFCKVNSNNGLAEMEQAMESIYAQKKLPVPTQNGTVFIKHCDIVKLQADANYTYIYTQDGTKQMSAHNLKKYADKLPPQQFLRCHHSTLINTDYITRINRRNYECILTADKEYVVKISRKGMKELDKLI
jgi:two-component system LytT family response regulator